MYRNTYVEIYLSNLSYNVKTLVNRYNDYKYHIGVVKADSYGHSNVVKTIVEAGCNYLAVATLEEALEIRKEIKDIPILCLGIIDSKYLPICVANNISITVSNLDYLHNNYINNDLKVHIKINTGMNRLGISSIDEFNKAYNLVKERFSLEGIYTHIYDASNEERTLKQLQKFEEITNNINLEEIPIIHIGASEATEIYPRKEYVNGCRLGISMYGLVDYQDIEFKDTFKLFSEVIQINEVENETVGYNGSYRVNGKEKIAVIPIGYADGIIRKNTGREVYINDKPYQIVGNICMDMLFVKVDDEVKVHDKVSIIKDIDHIKRIANHLDTITYEVICSIHKRVPRIYK